METIVRDLMTSPPVTCASTDSLAVAARTMAAAGIGSVVVTDRDKVAGILTERDLLRAAAATAGPDHEQVGLWMTPHPDVLSPDEKVDAAWASLTAHHYRHLPVVEDGHLVGVVSLRDLMGLARIRPAAESRTDVPAGLEGVVVAETTVGDVRGQEGFFHYRQYSAVDLAQQRSLEDVWHLLFKGELPDAAASASFASEVRARRDLPPGLAALLPALAAQGAPLDVLRSAVSVLGAELGWRPTHDVSAAELYDQALGLCAVVPTILASAYRLREGLEVVAPRTDLDFAANYLHMLTGQLPSAEHARAIEQYMILTIDHSSTPRPSRPGSSPRPVPTWPRRSSVPSVRCPALSMAVPPAGPSICSTPSARRTGPTPTSDAPWRTASGSWDSDTACTRPTTPARSCCAR